MTAIVSLFTPEGLLLAADGRLSIGGQLVTDTETKVARCDAENVRALFALHGMTGIDYGNFSFDFKEESKAVRDELRNRSFDNLRQYIEAFSQGLYNKFDFWAGYYFGGSIGNINYLEVLSLIVVGYVSGHAQMAVAHFDLNHGRLERPVLEFFSDNPGPDLNVHTGLKPVYEMMRSEGLIHPCGSVTEAHEMVTRYIQACANSPNDHTNTIGGQIHVAAVVPGRTFWLTRPSLDSPTGSRLAAPGQLDL